jgi:DNA-binding NarL/FixJ family response regulator
VGNEFHNRASGFYPIYPTLLYILIDYFLTFTYSIYTTPSINKIFRRENSEREIAAILVLYAKGYSAREIGDEIDVSKSTINRII